MKCTLRYLLSVAVAVLLLSCFHDRGPAFSPRSLSANEVKCLRGGDWTQNRDCKVPDECKDDPDMTACDKKTFLTCSGKEDEVLAELKEYTAVITPKKCEDGLQGLDDCRLVFPCEWKTQPTAGCRGGTLEDPHRAAKNCVSETVPD